MTRRGQGLKSSIEAPQRQLGSSDEDPKSRMEHLGKAWEVEQAKLAKGKHGEEEEDDCAVV